MGMFNATRRRGSCGGKMQKENNDRRSVQDQTITDVDDEARQDRRSPSDKTRNADGKKRRPRLPPELSVSGAQKRWLLHGRVVKKVRQGMFLVLFQTNMSSLLNSRINSISSIGIVAPHRPHLQAYHVERRSAPILFGLIICS